MGSEQAGFFVLYWGMEQAELQHFQELITAEISKLEQSEAYLKKETGVIAPDVAIGRLSRMEAIGEKSVNEEMQRQNQLRLSRLRNALKRIEDGSYGTCLGCNKYIPRGRLEIQPEALKCVPCQEKRRKV